MENPSTKSRIAPAAASSTVSSGCRNAAIDRSDRSFSRGVDGPQGVGAGHLENVPLVHGQVAQSHPAVATAHLVANSDEQPQGRRAEVVRPAKVDDHMTNRAVGRQ